MITNLSINTENVTKTQRYSHELHGMKGLFPPSVASANLHPTENRIKENNRVIVPNSIRGTMCTVKTMQTLICVGLVG